jgi:hypothetical protein
VSATVSALSVAGVWSQEAYLKAANADASDRFGEAVTISGDTLAVAAVGEGSNQTTITNGTAASSDNSLVGAGAVYIYRRSGSIWSPEAYVKAANAGPGFYDEFGSSISLSGDTLVVGATGEDSNQVTITNGTGASADNSLSDSGAVYIYARTGTSWAQQAYVKAANAGADDFFGTSVSISGEMLAVGAPSEDSNQVTITNGEGASADNTLASSGAVYIYRRNGSSWTQEAYVKGTRVRADAQDVYGDGFGRRVILSGDTLAVAAYDDGDGNVGPETSPANAGAVYIFRRTGVTWAQEAFIQADNAGQADFYGSSVALSGDTLAVGAKGEDSNQTTITSTGSSDNLRLNSGSVYVYRRTGSTWSQEAFVKASNADSGDMFGASVALVGDSLAVGAAGEDSNLAIITNGTAASGDNSLTNSGAVYVFQRTGSTWVQDAYLKASNVDAGDRFGTSVGFSGDTLLVGAPGESSNQTTVTNGFGASNNNDLTGAGAVYVFRNTGRSFEPEVRVSARTATSLTFKWNSNLGNATTVKVAVAVVGTSAPAEECIGGTVVAAGTTQYTYSGLTLGTKYGFRFCAWDGSSASTGTTLWESTPGTIVAAANCYNALSVLVSGALCRSSLPGDWSTWTSSSTPAPPADDPFYVTASVGGISRTVGISRSNSALSYTFNDKTLTLNFGNAVAGSQLTGASNCSSTSKRIATMQELFDFCWVGVSTWGSESPCFNQNLWSVAYYRSLNSLLQGRGHLLSGGSFNTATQRTTSRQYRCVGE